MSMEIQRCFDYPHSLSAKVVKNGRKKNDTQSYWCHECGGGGKFQDEYLAPQKENKNFIF